MIGTAQYVVRTSMSDPQEKVKGKLHDNLTSTVTKSKRCWTKARRSSALRKTKMRETPKADRAVATALGLGTNHVESNILLPKHLGAMRLKKFSNANHRFSSS